MNVKEIREIRRHFTTDDDLLIMNGVLTAVVDGEGELKTIASTPHYEISEIMSDVCFKTLKNVLNVKIGSKFTEYPFVANEYREGEYQSILYNFLNAKLKDDEINQKFIRHITDNIQYTGPYTVIIGHCTYTICKDSTLNYEDFNFIVAAICPLLFNGGGLAYDKSINNVFGYTEAEDVSQKQYISKIPTDGFMFPVFSDRSVDINHVGYYTKSPKTLNLSIIENILGCKFTMSANDERSVFKQLVSGVFEDKLNYTILQSINNDISSYIAENKNSTDIVKLSKIKFRDILEYALGFCDLNPETQLTIFDKKYDDLCGNYELSAINLVNKKMKIQSNSITISADPNAEISMKNNNQIFVNIRIYDNDVQINGFDIYV